MSTNPFPIAGGVRIPVSIIIEKDGRPTREFTKWLTDVQTRLQQALNILGQFEGTLGAQTTIATRTGTLLSALQNLSAAGLLVSTAISGVVPPANIPALSALSGAVTPAQVPSLSALSGSVTGSQLPAPTPASLGGVKEAGPVASEWINQIDATGTPQLSQPAFTDISGQITTAQLPALGFSHTAPLAKLTVGGSNGSLTFTNGLLTAAVDPT